MLLLLTGQEGPVRNLASFRFSEDEAFVALFVAQAWSCARNPTAKGMLAGKPAFEAWDMLCARLRSARSSSATWAGWWPVLLRSLKIQPEQVPQVYAILWESGAGALPDFRRWKYADPTWNRIQLAAGMLVREPGWRFEYRTWITTNNVDLTGILQEEVVYE